MFQLIEKLRAKPPRTKKLIAFSVALFFVGIILVVWLSANLPDFGGGQTQDNSVPKSDATPISSFTDTFSAGIQSIIIEAHKIKDSVSSLYTNPAVYISTTTPAVMSTTTEQTP